MLGFGQSRAGAVLNEEKSGAGAVRNEGKSGAGAVRNEEKRLIFYLIGTGIG